MRRSPSMALVSLDSPSMSFRSRERAAWPARHIDECTPPVALKERHTPLRSPHTSRSFNSSPPVNSASRRVKVDVAVAATGLKPDHICTTFTPGIRLSTTAGPHAREEVARLLEGGALFRKESGSRDFTCLYVVRASFGTLGNKLVTNGLSYSAKVLQESIIQKKYVVIRCRSFTTSYS